LDKAVFEEIPILKEGMQRFILADLSEACRRYSNELSKAGSKRSKAVIPNVETDARHTQIGPQEQIFGLFNTQGRQVNTWGNPCNAAEHAMKVKRAESCCIGYFLEGKWVLKM
jgi:hypothetical protein